MPCYSDSIEQAPEKKRLLMADFGSFYRKTDCLLSGARRSYSLEQSLDAA